jgi:hypothetical protein
MVACLALLIFKTSAAVRYVDVNSTNPVPPYTSWATAATNIQAAIDASTNADLILVTNGVYAGGLLVTNAIAIQSVNGAGVTQIDGNHTARCANLADGVALTGFTLANGNAFNGGGLFCASTSVMVSNCVFTGNSSSGNYAGGAFSGTLNKCTLVNNTNRSINDIGSGGGAAWSVLNNCIIANNIAGSGGGAANCTLSNCVLRGNLALAGGGAIGATLNNCLVVSNTAFWDFSAENQPAGGGIFGGTAINCTIFGNAVEFYSNYHLPVGGGAYGGSLKNCIIYGNKFGIGSVDNYAPGTLTNCCTTPLPASGANNFANAPLFVNQNGGDFHLQSGSPCINAGNNAYVSATNDLDGNPRIKGGTVDVGAYEYQTPASIISYAWLQQYGLPTTGSADYLDSDADGMNNWQEWIAGTTPTNALSVLRMLSPNPTNNPPGLVVSWQSVNTRTYYLQSSANPGAQPAFSAIQSNIAGQAGTTSYTDTNAVGSGPFFYRVGVQ